MSAGSPSVTEARPEGSDGAALASTHLSSSDGQPPPGDTSSDALKIFINHLQMPRERSRWACVSRGWRAAVKTAARIPRVVLSGSIEDKLHRALSHSAGALVALDLSDVFVWSPPVLLDELGSHSATLRELRLPPDAVVVPAGRAARSFCGTKVVDLGELLVAAPRLKALHANVLCSWNEASSAVRREPPFTSLVLRELRIDCGEDNHSPGAGARLSDVAGALADRALQPTLERLEVQSAELSPAQSLEVLADAVLARRLPRIAMCGCSPAAPAILARLLGGNVLEELHATFPYGEVALLDDVGASLVAASLRSTHALTSLVLRGTSIATADAAPVACALLGALTGHASLRLLELSHEYGGPMFLRSGGARRALGAALGALVAADAPALQSLNLCFNYLKASGMRPLVQALVGNRHLLKLNITYNRLYEAFARDVLLPAVRANTSLVELQCLCGNHEQDPDSAFEKCEDLVEYGSDASSDGEDEPAQDH